MTTETHPTPGPLELLRESIERNRSQIANCMTEYEPAATTMIDDWLRDIAMAERIQMDLMSSCEAALRLLSGQPSERRLSIARQRLRSTISRVNRG